MHVAVEEFLYLLAVAPEVVSLEKSAGVAAVLAEGGDQAVARELVAVEQFAVLRGVGGGAGGARARAAVSHAAAAVALPGSRTAEELV